MKVKANLNYRRAAAEDVPALARLHRRAILAGGEGYYSPEERESWAAGLDAAFYETALGTADSFELACDESGAILAMGAARGDEVSLLYTDPGNMGQGIGAALLARLEADIKARGHMVMKLRSSLNAEPFYAARGWRAVKYLGHVTRGGRTLGAVEMEKPGAG